MRAGRRPRHQGVGAGEAPDLQAAEEAPGLLLEVVVGQRRPQGLVVVAASALQLGTVAAVGQRPAVLELLGAAPLMVQPHRSSSTSSQRGPAKCLVLPQQRVVIGPQQPLPLLSELLLFCEAALWM